MEPYINPEIDLDINPEIDTEITSYSDYNHSDETNNSDHISDHKYNSNYSNIYINPDKNFDQMINLINSYSNRSQILDRNQKNNLDQIAPIYKNHPNIKILNDYNKYRINYNQIKLLGQGAYGSVYKVFHKYEKKFYAIKKVFITKDLIKENYDIFREIQIFFPIRKSIYCKIL